MSTMQKADLYVRMYDQVDHNVVRADGGSFDRPNEICCRPYDTLYLLGWDPEDVINKVGLYRRQNQVRGPS